MLKLIGFNSFTQELCIDNAVVRGDDTPTSQEGTKIIQDVAQSVTYKTSIIDKVTDVTDAMNVLCLRTPFESSRN